MKFEELKIDEKFELSKLDGGYVINRKEPSGEEKLYMKINQTSAVIWVLLQKKLTPNEILTEIVSLYNIDEERAKNDINDFLNALLEHKILKIG
jgi:hypothetical protein